jgi:hypothetical protein
MIELSKFIGTWRASEGFPFSTHIFTWETAEWPLARPLGD